MSRIEICFPKGIVWSQEAYKEPHGKTHGPVGTHGGDSDRRRLRCSAFCQDRWKDPMLFEVPRPKSQRSGALRSYPSGSSLRDAGQCGADWRGDICLIGWPRDHGLDLQHRHTQESPKLARTLAHDGVKHDTQTIAMTGQGLARIRIVDICGVQTSAREECRLKRTSQKFSFRSSRPSEQQNSADTSVGRRHPCRSTDSIT